MYQLARLHSDHVHQLFGLGLSTLDLLSGGFSRGGYRSGGYRSGSAHHCGCCAERTSSCGSSSCEPERGHGRWNPRDKGLCTHVWRGSPGKKIEHRIVVTNETHHPDREVIAKVLDRTPGGDVDIRVVQPGREDKELKALNPGEQAIVRVTVDLTKVVSKEVDYEVVVVFRVGLASVFTQDHRLILELV